jgi:mannose-6-phosphate isomerase-like protein (cupin superfamily)
MKSGKAWGVTRELITRNGVGVHHIEIDAGGYCSKHRHVHKCNLFYVVHGQLEVEVWKSDYPLVDRTLLSANEQMVVAPGEYHRFRAISPVQALEIYWTELDEADIERDECGGNGKSNGS